VKSEDKTLATAIFDYFGAAGDLSFRVGDKIRIIRHIDEHWVEGEFQGRTGSAPTNHLEVS